MTVSLIAARVFAGGSRQGCVADVRLIHEVVPPAAAELVILPGESGSVKSGGGSCRARRLLGRCLYLPSLHPQEQRHQSP
jgi:hypothetical protein